MRNFDKSSRFSGGGDRPQRSFGGPRGGFGGKPTMFKATCAKCGNDCEVLFRPSGTRPVFCSNCFKNQGNAGGSPKFAPKSFGDGNRGGNFGAGNTNISAGGAVSKGQFDALNAKLDRIISLLGATKPVVETPKIKTLEMKEIIKKVKASAKKSKSKRK